MDPTSDVSIPLNEREFGYASNRHLNEWITESEMHTTQIQAVYMEVDQDKASKQPRVNSRKEEVNELWSDFERTMQARSNELESENYSNKSQSSGVWTEDFITNEVDPMIKLKRYDEMVAKSEELMTET